MSLFDLFWKYRRLVLLGLLFLILSDACQLVIPLVVKRVVDALAAGRETPGPVDTAMVVITALVTVVVASRYAWRHFLFRGSRLAEAYLREQLLAKVLRLPSGHFQALRTGDVMALATNDVMAVRMALAMGVVAGFDATVFAIVAIACMLALDPVLTVWTILPFPVLGIIMAVALRLIYQRWDRVQAAFEDLTEKARESLAGMRVLRAFVQADGDSGDFDRYNVEYYRRQMSYVRVDSLYQPSIVVLAGLSSAVLLGVGGTRVATGLTSLGSFTAFVSYLGMLAWPMIAAGWMLTLFQRGAASLSRINALLAAEEEPQEAVLPSASPGVGQIEVRHLTFTYPNQERPALTDVSFEVPKAGTIGLVGEVGSGKSTLALLLSRLYEPPPGTVFLDGRAVETVPLRWLRQQVAWVPQEAFLFSDTIENNLRVGRADATREEMEAACRLSAVHNEILEFPDGYRTLLGERGISLSGGQKQRLCLARALLKQAPVMVLDDTLSAVDSETEHAILTGLKDAMAGRTTVVIAHRISSLRHLDWILVLRDGHVIQQGRHQTLLAVPGFYRDLYELQELEA